MTRCKGSRFALLALGAALFLGTQIPMTAQAGNIEVNLSDISKDYTCKDKNDDYYFKGSSTKQSIIVDCGGSIDIHLSNVYINDDDKAGLRIKKGSSVTLYLEGDNTLYGGDNHAGLQVDEGASVTILGNGKLTATGSGKKNHGAAGIGSEYNESAGKIVIGSTEYSPTIIAKSGDGGAGIGSGEDGRCDDGIYIYNGDITATGTNGGAGIGGGDAVGAGDGGKTKNIVISGGTVRATGGSGAAGIGGSETGSSGEGGDVSNITISGGNITAIGGSEAAGIGGSKDCYAENITISGGTITATGGKYGAGIGGGNAVGTGKGGYIDNLKITGGTITATGGESAAGIGGGDQSAVTNFRIEEAGNATLHITATGGEWGAGIGNGNSGVAGNAGIISTNVEAIYIKLNGGTITAKGGYGGAGIGGGNCEAKKIEIYGKGTINATGFEHASAIGAGYDEDGGVIIIEGDSGGKNLVIDAKTKKDRGSNDAAVIGGADSKGGDITIKNAKLTLWSPSETEGTAIGTGLNKSLSANGMGTITIENCYIKDDNYQNRNAASIGSSVSSEVEHIKITDSYIYGGSIGSSDNGNEFMSEPTVKSISITNSDITAIANHGQRAAIGSGRYAGIERIFITNSKVYAESVSGAGIGSGGYDFNSGGDLFRMTGNACGDIEISGSTIIAIGGNGSAGIGGGWGTPVGNVKIYGNSDVTATGGNCGSGENKQGGAGIGGGSGESCGNISISNSTVTAVGGNMSAGIGSSGDHDATVFLWNTTCHSISINGSTVTATAGDNAAGIGTGMGAQFGSGAQISISDSVVTATGGKHGAGIGAGSDAYSGYGGEACNISVTGTSKVVANGGEGAAGIGGGYDGGADTVDIDLYQTKRAGDDWLYYVKATGGAGAAGIGGGGVDVEGEIKDGITDGHGIDKVTISDGYVYAQGGTDDNGAGAGIGGGARGGNIKSFQVSGGFIEAHAGYGTGKAGADDIGTGGDDYNSAEDKDFKITGGTVIGGLSSDPDKIIIDGGSVRHNTNKAVNSDGTKVYRTIMQVEEGAYYEPPYLAITSCDFKEWDIFSDENSRIYLYLPESAKDAAKAQYYENWAYKNYYGTTTTDGEGWLKMGMQMKFRPLEKQPVVGEEFTLVLDDADLNGTIEFEVSGKNIEKISEKTTAPGAEVTLKASGRTEYTVTAETIELQSDLYWGTTATYSGKITQDVATIEFTENPSKVYDGTPVENPSVRKNSDAEVKYKYYDAKTGNSLTGPPTEAGTYKVKASIEATDSYTGAETKPMEFTIFKRDVALAITATESGTDATVTVEVLGAIDADGEKSDKINIWIGDVNGNVINQKDVDIEPNSDTGKYEVTVPFKEVTADKYRVRASYYGGTNHNEANSERMFDKTLADRTIEVILDDKPVSTITVDYGAEPEIITAKLSEDERGDGYSFEVVSDPLSTIGEETVGLSGEGDSRELTFNNAGKAVIKVTASNPAYYRDAVAYLTVIVERKDIAVTSYAYKIDDSGNKTPVHFVDYGAIDTLSYGLLYGGEEDIPEDFAIGTLEAIPPNETLGVGSDGRIAIARIGKDLTIGEKTYNVFVSRNYNITYVPGKIAINPAKLEITANDVTCKYGEKVEYSYRVDGITSWDSEESVFETNPVVSLDTTKTNGKSYEELAPGEYEDALVITDAEKGEIKSNGNVVDGEEQKNYEIASVKSGTLTIERGSVLIDVEAESKIYDKKAIETQVTVTPAAAEGITADMLEKPSDAVIIYFGVGEDGTLTELSAAPKDAGNYLVKVMVPENDYYEEAEAEDYFRIHRARYEIDAPEVPDMLMKDGLTLADQKLPEGWAWINPSKELQVGYVSAYAVYTPEDIDNYFRAIRRVTFVVYDENSEDPGTGGNGSGSDDNGTGGGEAGSSENTAVGTGDNSPIRPFIILLVVSGIAIIVVIAIKRNNEVMHGHD